MTLLVTALLLMTRFIALPLGTHILFVAQALVFPLFPCQPFAFQPQAFALRRPALTFQHLLPLAVVAIPLGLLVRPVVVVIRLVVIRLGIRLVVPDAAGQQQRCHYEYSDSGRIQSGHNSPPGCLCVFGLALMPLAFARMPFFVKVAL